MPDTAAAGRLILVRHGRTAWNAERRRLGRTDVPLDDTGRAQAAALARRLHDIPLDAVYCSPLQRARDTALAVTTPRALPLHVSDDLLEFDYGDYNGTLRDGVRLSLRRTHLRVAVPGGESLADAWARASRFVAAIAPALEQGACLLAVGHQQINRLIAGAGAGQSLEEAVADEYRPAHGEALDLRVQAGRVVARGTLGPA